MKPKSKWQVFFAVAISLLLLVAVVALTVSLLNWHCTTGEATAINWRRTFLCNATATDLSLAWLTLLYVAVATWQGFQLKRTVDSSEAASAPYVFPEITTLSLVKDGAFPPDVAVTLVNHGKTPAKMLGIRFQLHLVRDMQSQPSFNSDEFPQSAVRIIGAEQSEPSARVIRYKKALSPEELANFGKKIKDPEAVRFFLTGQLRYEDFFGNTIVEGCCFKLFKNNTYMIKPYRAHTYRFVFPKGTAVPEKFEPEEE